MKKPLQIGITGGIGSGKSTVCRIFSTLGIPIYDADSRAKSLMTTDGILIEQIKKEFGVLSFRSDGNMDREYLARTVFQDKEKLERLNKLIHPRVAQDYERWVSEQKNDYLLKEDKVILVHAPSEIRIKRVLERDPQRTRQQVEDIMRNQMQDEEKLKLADFSIVNDESRLVIPQVLELHEVFKSMTK